MEYLSYLLNFMSVIAGPCNNFKDYVAFIEGRHTHMKLLEVKWKQKGFQDLPEPSPTVSLGGAKDLPRISENWVWLPDKALTNTL